MVLWIIVVRELAIFQEIAFRLAELRWSFYIPSTSVLRSLLNLWQACREGARTVFCQHQNYFEAKMPPPPDNKMFQAICCARFLQTETKGRVGNGVLKLSTQIRNGGVRKIYRHTGVRSK